MANPKVDSTGQIQKASQVPAADSLATFLTSIKGEIARAMPKHLTPDRMARVVMTALRTVPDLALCTRESFAGCVMQLAQLGLEPNTPLGHAWLIPRRDSRKSEKAGRPIVECTIIIGYQGFLELGRRAGVNVYAHVVRDGDQFNYALGLHPKLEHVPSEAPDREKKRITHVYAVARTKEFADSPIFVVLSKAQVDARKARSATAGKSFSPWQSDEEAMTLKTAVRALWRWMPKQIEQSMAEALDSAADSGTSQAAVFDPAVAAALQNQGLQLEEGDDDSPQLTSGDESRTDELRNAVEARSGSVQVTLPGSE